MIQEAKPDTTRQHHLPGLNGHLKGPSSAIASDGSTFDSL